MSVLSASIFMFLPAAFSHMSGSQLALAFRLVCHSILHDLQDSDFHLVRDHPPRITSERCTAIPTTMLSSNLAKYAGLAIP